MKATAKTSAMILTFLATVAAPAPLVNAQLPAAPQESPNADVERAYDALGNGDFATALSILKPLAQEGQARAQYYLGRIYDRGWGVESDQLEAVRLYTLSALQGYSDAFFSLGQKYYSGEGIATDQKSAADLFLLGAITGDRDAQWAIGHCFLYGEGRDQDVLEGTAWLMLAADQGEEYALEELAKVKSAVDTDAYATARSVADQFQSMIQNDEFDPAKMPKVPVPAGLQLDSSTETNTPTEEAELVHAGMTTTAQLLPTGDIKGHVEITFPDDVFKMLREQIAEPHRFLRDLKPTRAKVEVSPFSTARYDEARSAVVINLHLLGAVENRGNGFWVYKPDEQKFVNIDEQNATGPVALFEIDNPMPEDDLILTGQARYTLPQGATQVHWDAVQEALCYYLPYTGPTGEGRLSVKFGTRSRMMSGLYNVYGMSEEMPTQWVAKAVFTNTGEGPLTDLKVRFQLGNYSDLDLWHKFPELVPGQTVVVTYHPVLSERIAEITSTTAANIVARWEYTDMSGEQHEDGDGARISILGRHEFAFSNLVETDNSGTFANIYSNTDLLAGWITRDDPVVRQFAEAARRAAGGANASSSDEAACAALEACYELLRANGMVTTVNPEFQDEGITFDSKRVQNIKPSRDVIHDRSGTTIEMSALYCGMAHALGLKPYLAVIYGHVFPLIQLPSGDYIPVEMLGVRIAGGGGEMSFEETVEAAAGIYREALGEGHLVEIDIESAWARGISGPELEALPEDILKRWNVALEVDLNNKGDVAQNGGSRPSGPVQPGSGAVTRPASNTSSPASGSFAGNWTGTVRQPMMDGSTISWSTTLNISQGRNGVLDASLSARTQVSNGWGGRDTYQVDEVMQGQSSGAGQLVLKGLKKTTSVNGQSMQDLPSTLTLSLQGGQLQGTLKLADGSSVTVNATRR
jgi:hypothetical protein